MTTQRIATVKATGDRYIVQQIAIGRTEAETRVHCWGEVTSYKTGRGRTDAERLATGASTKHQASKTFLRSAVDIADVVVTGHIAQQLLAQATRNLKNVVGTASRRVR